MRLAAYLFTLSLACASALPAQPFCRHALVLALDVSGSVDEFEYERQIAGLATALASSPVRDILLAEPAAPISVAVFEWSSQNHQGLVQDWIEITGEAALDRLVAAVRGHKKQRAGLKTAIGRAVQFAAALLEERAHCLRRTIDVSGDGENNIGPVPKEAYLSSVFAGITVNALVIGDPSPEGAAPGTVPYARSDLRDYYEAEVIHGPGAFAMIAEGYRDYARAMTAKLVRELSAPSLSLRVPPAVRRPL